MIRPNLWSLPMKQTPQQQILCPKSLQLIFYFSSATSSMQMFQYSLVTTELVTTVFIVEIIKVLVSGGFTRNCVSLMFVWSVPNSDTMIAIVHIYDDHDLICLDSLKFSLTIIIVHQQLCWKVS